MKQIVCGVLLSCSLACAFVDPSHPQESTPTAPGGMEADWSDSPYFKIGERTRMRRNLAQSGIELKADFPITLPESVPANLYLRPVIPTTMLNEPIAFARASFSSEQESIRIPTDALSVLPNAKNGGQTTEVSLSVSGMNVAFPREIAIKGDLSIEVFGAHQKLFVLNVPLRTPPSQVKVEPMLMAQTLNEFKAERRLLLRPSSRTGGMSLIRAFNIKNDEAQSVTLEFSRLALGQFGQTRTEYSYRDTGCGYAVDTPNQWVPLADKMWFLPIDRNLIMEVEVSLAAPAPDNRFHIEVPSGETRWVGLFGSGPNAAKWGSRGPEATSLQVLSVPSNCYRQCTSWSHGGWDPHMPVAPQRVCEHWEDRRNTATVQIGSQFSEPTLQLASDPSWTVRYSDESLHDDAEPRLITGIPTQAEIDWIKL